MQALVSVGSSYVGRVPDFVVGPPWWSDIEATTNYLDDLLGVSKYVLRLLNADHANGGRRVSYHAQAAAEPRPGVLDPAPCAERPDVIRPHPLRSSWAEVDARSDSPTGQRAFSVPTRRPRSRPRICPASSG